MKYVAQSGALHNHVAPRMPQLNISDTASLHYLRVLIFDRQYGLTSNAVFFEPTDFIVDSAATWYIKAMI
jgi:hypothetical protein